MEKAGHHNVQIVLAGGAAKKIRREFTRSILHKEDLILLGLLEIAKSL
jgi:pantothenate kinase type III